MKNNNKIYIVIVSVFYTSLLILYAWWFPWKLSGNTANWGTFGDFLGGALSPIIGIISVILTYKIINNQNVQDNQTEFKYMFEILFNSLPTKKESIVRNDLKGEDALIRINNDIDSVFKGVRRSDRSIEVLQAMREAFWGVHEEINQSSNPFMKNLHNCLKVIDIHCVDARKNEYADLLRAQLSKEDLIFIFYNALADDSFGNFKTRIEKYAILKDVAKHKFNSSLKKQYSPSAFENSKEVKNHKIYSFVWKRYALDIKINSTAIKTTKG